jgi:16S rRNA (guanine527-N7)-methyltransferase
LNKRISFLDTVIKELNLSQISALHGRAEDFGHKTDFRENFDFCVSRAVAKLTILSEYCLPYVNIGGYFIPYKSGKIEEEIMEAEKAVHILGATIERCEEFLLPGTDMERSLILIHKTKKTPIQYPRTAGKPAKEPLR